MIIDDETLFAEFESLGEVEVENRLTHFAFENITRIYAERWLNRKIDQQLRATQLERESAAEEAKRRRFRQLTGLATHATLAAAAILLTIVLVVTYRSVFT